MNKQKIHDYFNSGATRPYEFRRAALEKLQSAIGRHEADIMSALHKDLGKNPAEALLSEIGPTLHEIKFAIKNLHRWMRPSRARSPWYLWPATSKIHYEPRGVVLILAPWNYPFQLVMAPLVGATAAGNCSVVKPSELSVHTSALIQTIIGEAFSEEYVTTVLGDVEVSKQLLNEPWDHIFFTGGTEAGKHVMEAASRHLTPVTLELGGQNPTLVLEDCDIAVTARRIVWGKFFNAGQSCLAPNYLLVQKKIFDPLLEKLQQTVRSFYGDDPLQSKDYGRIISNSHFKRLQNLLQSTTAKIIGGKQVQSEQYLEPTFVVEPSLQDPIMNQEIFGPLLPILAFEQIEQAFKIVKEKPRPLALYVFTSTSARADAIVSRISYGGGCINDTLVQFANVRLPFGGVGASGIGAYHGRFSFEQFSHRKSIVKRSYHPDISVRYPPYRKKLGLIRKIFMARSH